MNNNLTIIYIVRHGESEANSKEITGGDFPLTEKGRQQIKDFIHQLGNIQFDAIFSSGLLRARQTAEIIALRHKLNTTCYKELRERNYGRYEGCKSSKYMEEMKQVFKKIDTMSYNEIKKYKRYEGYETDEEMMTRFITTVRELAIAYKGKTILIVSHSGLMNAFLLHLGYATYKGLPANSIKNGGYIKLESDGIDFFLKEVIR